MNCDQVFERLTRGPFPQATTEDAYVERHLTACHECRCLAEALRPAVELCHESLDEQSWPALPEYRGWLESASVCQTTAPELIAETTTSLPTAAPLLPASPAEILSQSETDDSTRRQSPAQPKLSLPGMLALVVAGIWLIAWITNGRSGIGTDGVTIDGTAATGRIHKISATDPPREFFVAQVPRRLLQTLGVADACLIRSHLTATELEPRRDNIQAQVAVVCCTYCHAADAAYGLQSISLARLSSACVACHRSADTIDHASS